jgi:propionyl-CoA synthetase
LASVLKNRFNIEVGDRVLIYMPMVIEAAFAMLACARIGATHSVVFGGFAAKELASRIDDCTPKLIMLSSMGIEPGKHIPYAPIVDEALSHCVVVEDAESIPRLIKQRDELDGKLRSGELNEHYSDYDELFDEEEEEAECVDLPSTHPLYILYTSGTTGEPKGVVRDTGGTAVGLDWCMANVFNVHEDSVHFASSDIGWVVGHSFIIYGPLLRGCQTVFFEGKPVVKGNAGVIWEKCAQYKITSLYMAPTAVRVIKKEDYDGEFVKKHDISCVQTFSLVGERCDPDTIKWLHKNVPHVIINDTWW